MFTGHIAQWTECLASNQNVGGSNPSMPVMGILDRLRGVNKDIADYEPEHPYDWPDWATDYEYQRLDGLPWGFGDVDFDDVDEPNSHIYRLKYDEYTGVTFLYHLTEDNEYIAVAGNVFFDGEEQCGAITKKYYIEDGELHTDYEIFSDDDDSHIGTGVYSNIVREVSLDFTEMKVLAEQLDRKI